MRNTSGLERMPPMSQMALILPTPPEPDRGPVLSPAILQLPAHSFPSSQCSCGATASAASCEAFEAIRRTL